MTGKISKLLPIPIRWPQPLFVIRWLYYIVVGLFRVCVCVLIPCYVMYVFVPLLVLQVFCLGKERWFACQCSLSVPPEAVRWSVIVTFPGHTHLSVDQKSMRYLLIMQAWTKIMENARTRQ